MEFICGRTGAVCKSVKYEKKITQKRQEQSAPDKRSDKPRTSNLTASYGKVYICHNSCRRQQCVQNTVSADGQTSGCDWFSQTYKYYHAC